MQQFGCVGPECLNITTCLREHRCKLISSKLFVSKQRQRHVLRLFLLFYQEFTAHAVSAQTCRVQLTRHSKHFSFSVRSCTSHLFPPVPRRAAAPADRDTRERLCRNSSFNLPMCRRFLLTEIHGLVKPEYFYRLMN